MKNLQPNEGLLQKRKLKLKELEEDITGIMNLCNDEENLTTHNLEKLEEITEDYLDLLQKIIFSTKSKRG